MKEDAIEKQYICKVYDRKTRKIITGYTIWGTCAGHIEQKLDAVDKTLLIWTLSKPSTK